MPNGRPPSSGRRNPPRDPSLPLSSPSTTSTSPSDVELSATSTTRSTPTSCAPSAMAVVATATAHDHLGWREIPYNDDVIRFPRGPKFQRGFFAEIRPIPMRWPRMLKEFLSEMQKIPTRMLEFEHGLWKERPTMVHGMREAEGREVTREKVREKREEGEDKNLVNRFWTIINRF